MKTRNISGSGQVFSLLLLSQCFWLLCCRPPLANGLLSMAAAAIVYGVVFLLSFFCRRYAAGDAALPPLLAGGGALFAIGYFSITAAQLLAAVRVVFAEAFSPLFLLLVLLAAVWMAVSAGQEALGRAAFICLFLFLVAGLLLVLGVLTQGTALNLRLPEQDLSGLGKEILTLLPWQIEPFLLLLLAPRCSHPRSAALLLWAPAGWLLNGIFLLMAALVLGHYGSLQPYPMVLLAQSAGLSGMVPAYCFLLLTSAFFRLSALGMAALRLSRRAVGRSKLPFWLAVPLSFGGVALLHYAGWPLSVVYGIWSAVGIFWLLLLLCVRGVGNKRHRLC